jgi:hypothetical protein
MKRTIDVSLRTFNIYIGQTGDSKMIDFGTLFSQLIATYWWLPPLFVLTALFKSAWFKGFIGEVMVNMAAKLFLDKKCNHPDRGW